MRQFFTVGSFLAFLLVIVTLMRGGNHRLPYTASRNANRYSLSPHPNRLQLSAPYRQTRRAAAHPNPHQHPDRKRDSHVYRYTYINKHSIINSHTNPDLDPYTFFIPYRYSDATKGTLP